MCRIAHPKAKRPGRLDFAIGRFVIRRTRSRLAFPSHYPGSTGPPNSMRPPGRAAVEPTMPIEIQCDRCHHAFEIAEVTEIGDPFHRFRCPQCAETVMILADAFAGETAVAANDDRPAPPQRPKPPPWDDDVDLEIDLVLDGWLGAL
jgi:hypothetical protein